MASSREKPLSKSQFEELAEFRYQMRRFERFSEKAARSCGITSLQYLLLLHIKGYPGREHANVGELAERLQAHPHGVVTLITRCEARGLVRRRPSRRDGREVEVHLLAAGERVLAKLATLHQGERRKIHDVFSIPARDA